MGGLCAIYWHKYLTLVFKVHIQIFTIIMIYNSLFPTCFVECMSHGGRCIMYIDFTPDGYGAQEINY
jgi:hypothetical protein